MMRHFAAGRESVATMQCRQVARAPESWRERSRFDRSEDARAEPARCNPLRPSSIAEGVVGADPSRFGLVGYDGIGTSPCGW
jgi:hypothetical protein